MRPALGDRAAQRGGSSGVPSRCSCPTTSSSVTGRSRAGRGPSARGTDVCPPGAGSPVGKSWSDMCVGVSLQVAAAEDQVGDRADGEHVGDRERPQQRAGVLRAAERPEARPRRRSRPRCPPSARAAPTGRAPRTAAPRTRSTRCRAACPSSSASPIWPSSPAARPAPKTMKTAMPLAVVREDGRAQRARSRRPRPPPRASPSAGTSDVGRATSPPIAPVMTHRRREDERST